jgi:hypothetical protein
MPKQTMLIRDVLDNQMVDRRQRNIGKVDGIALVLRKGRPPRVAYLEQGAVVLAGRIGPRSARFAEWLSRKLGVRKEPVFRIPWSNVLDVGLDVDVDIDGATSPAWAWERWLRKHVVARLPFGRGGRRD